ncbi:hypothetical protein Q0590_05325 [Rhodocytophaga aerolata]|uniref:Uncharacterized protein n=1 Tax=Rhodocytophaga aerolata TaxID=455078 RepID=A0ABT8R2Z8_9BACT|nr:hypothetical protein [Rhodocytophaga aerolata]MDO1445658.1 hypothetical protein [Rhodocytophaga aerolata]
MNTLSTDLLILAITIVCCFLYNFVLYRHPEYASKKGFTYFLVFLAMYPLLNMMAHLIAITTFAVIRIQAGVFQYDMKFYTLIQFGVLLVLINGYLLHAIQQLSRGNKTVYRSVVLACVLQSAIILPLFPFNPISLLPVITSGLLLLTLTFTLKGRRVTPGNSVLMEANKPATYA